MSAREEKSDAVDPLEAQLAALRPRIDRLDRDRLMFLAGQASAGRATETGALSVRFWRVVAGAMTAVAATLLAVIMVRPAPTAGVPASAGIALTPGGVKTGTAPSQSPELASLPPADNMHAAGLGWLLFASTEPADLDSPSTAYLQLRAAALTGRLERDRTTGLNGPRNGIQETSPFSNRQLLDSLLDEPAIGSPPHRSSLDSRFQGAHS